MFSLKLLYIEGKLKAGTPQIFFRAKKTFKAETIPYNGKKKKKDK